MSLNGSTGSLTVGTGAAPGTANSLNINSGFTLTMGTRPVTLDGGSIAGLGALSATGTVSGYGTISSLLTGTSFSATATDGKNFGGFSSFVNGTPGTPITLIGQSNLTNDPFAISNHGDFNFQGVTLTTPTLSGVSTNLNAGSLGGNNFYGLLSFSGAASTLVGNVNNTNYEQFDINGTTLHLNNFSLTNSWAINVPPFFVVNAGGVLDNTVGNSNMSGHMATVLNGGTISNTGGGTFTFAGLITGTGTVSGPIAINGGLTVSGGLLTVDGTAGGGVTIGATGWGASPGSTLDLKGTFNYPSTGGFLNPGGGTIQLDGATLNNATGKTIYTGAGSFVANSGVNTLNTALVPNGSNSTVADYTVKSGATLSLNNPSSLNPAISGRNFSMENNSKLMVAGAGSALSISGNFSYQQTDTIHGWTNGGTQGLGPDLIMTGGTSTSPTTLEAGSVNKGFNAAAFLKNFALNSLTLGGTVGAYVDLVDTVPNATVSGWKAGTESLYVDALFGLLPGANVTIPTLNLGGLFAYDLTCPTGEKECHTYLTDGLYTDAKGGEINIIGAPTPTPEPATLALFGTGLAGLGLLRRRRR